VGWQDLDLLYRARLIGLRYQQHRRGSGAAVDNGWDAKMANVQLPDALAARAARDAYTSTLASNIITALGRPVRLRFEDQQQFSGVLNFLEETVI
jgi:hypothetical protein